MEISRSFHPGLPCSQMPIIIDFFLFTSNRYLSTANIVVFKFDTFGITSWVLGCTITTLGCGQCSDLVVSHALLLKLCIDHTDEKSCLSLNWSHYIPKAGQRKADWVLSWSREKPVLLPVEISASSQLFCSIFSYVVLSVHLKQFCFLQGFRY